MIDPVFFAHVNALLRDHPASVTRWVSTPLHNKAVGGAPHSGHLPLYGPGKDSAVAVDLVFDSPEELKLAAQAALQAGFLGIEVDLLNSHLHLDELSRMWRVVHHGAGRESPLDQWLIQEV